MPLTPEVLARIKTAVANAEAKIKELEPEINRAMLAKIDVSDAKKQLEAYKAQVAAMKIQYNQ